MSITQAILDELSVLYGEVRESLQEAIGNGIDEDLIDSMNDEVKAIAQTYNDIATGNVEEIS
jgi:hypothetical protein